MPTIGEALAAARRTVDAVDARVLLCHAVGRNAAYLAAHADSTLRPEQRSAYEACIARRAAGEPVAYLIGRREFYGLEFQVTPAVLIPRPETELLVDLALARIPREEKWHVLDLGTGSGCIALSIANARPRCRIVAIDRAPEALALEVLRRHLPPVPIDEWERKLFAAATDCGVSLSDEALSSDGLYE